MTQLLRVSNARAGDSSSYHGDPLRFLSELTKQQGDVCGYQCSPWGLVFVVNRPEYIQHVLRSGNYQRASILKAVIGGGLAAAEGDHWSRQRRLLQPAFSAGNARRCAKLICGETARMLDQWDVYAQRATPLNVSDELVRLTLRIVTGALFSWEAGEVQELADAVRTIIVDLGRIARTLFREPFQLNAAGNQRLQRAIKVLDDFVHEIVEQRRRETNPPQDLLCMLMTARDPETGAALTDQQLRDELVTMLIGGHENISLMISWSLHLLSEHPAIESHFCKQLQQIMQGPVATVEEIDRLDFCRMVLEESMRLYPPVWQMTRKTLAADNIGECQIPTGAAVVVSIYTMHRHADFWDEPERFHPERFAGGSANQRPPFAYLPFGGGPHHCVGDKLAMLESQIILASIVRRYRLHPLAGHRIEPLPVLTLRMKDGFLATLETRQ